MKRFSLVAILSVTFAVFSASCLLAQGPGGRGGFGGGRDMLNALRNADGAIDLSKASGEIPDFILERVKSADKNGDGLIDAEEEQALAAARGGRGEAGSGPGATTPDVPKGKMRVALTGEEKANLQALRAKMAQDGIEFLKKSQSSNGSFSASPRVGIGPTIIDAIGLLRAGVKIDEPVLAKALAFLEASVHDDGGIYSEGMRLSSYESCLGLVCFTLANRQAGDGRYDKLLADAEKFVRGSQYNAENGVSKDDEYFGGVGYGNGSMTRPDLSNTQFFVEALREIGADEDDQAIQDALVFVSRCQNLESEDNVSGRTTSNDGGFIYTFVSGEENPAGQEVSGGLRSYGSITYAGLKSLIYAGLKADDPRVEAATNWIRDNYSTTENPGLGKKGLYYYYHTFAKCFQALGVATFEDKSGVAHDWRKELIETLALAQNDDGSWVNDDRMWYETDANLVTGYVLIVLSYCAEGEGEK
ncbi:MAG: terpene cyclase/mutase family protein [Thermoguttaceae bacterium]|nr:terpene cyclase/mutase family protein [Thermoguttaceae bacterium]